MNKCVRLYNVVFIDGTARSIECSNKKEAKRLAEEFWENKVKSVTRCYRKKSDKI